MRQTFNLQLATPIGSLDTYIRAVKTIPVLSAEEEFALAVSLQEHNDLSAAQRLIMAHLRFVVHIARGYSGYGLALGDLIQEGNIGLMKAVRRFDPRMKVRLVSFAVHWIRAEIHEFVLRNWRIVKMATTKAQRKLFFNLRGAKKRLGWFNQEEVNAVAKDLGVSPEAVREMEMRLSGQDISFDADEDDEDEAPNFAPAAYLQDLRMEPARQVEQQDTTESGSEQLNRALANLDPRSRDILARRWLAEKKSTLQDLAKRHKVSAERIRQLENNAIKKLKAALAGC
ncbi:MAG: RNA polymerase sigma factor RpoH [Gammaproteobacteria bacterium]|nr:RNA polymerase sigma factor RpoH [Gammaproteobacteria bacterium]